MTSTALSEQHLPAIAAYSGDNLWEDLLYGPSIVGDLDAERQEATDPTGHSTIAFRDGSTVELSRGAWTVA